MATAYHVTPARNLKRIRQEGLFPRIGTRSKLAGEQERAVFCFANREDMENALSNWLGDQFKNEDQLAILTLDVKTLNQQTEINSYEVKVFEHIATARIVGIEDEMGRCLLTA